MSAKEDLKLLNKIKNKIKSSKTVKDMFEESNLSLDIIDVVPMCFDDNLEVSARTQHGIIYFNGKLRDKSEEIDHYMVHELTHIIQQCFSEGPTRGSNDSNYLDNPYEQEGFQNQTKFLSETEGKETAEYYIDKVLEHHDIPKKEKNKKKDSLLSLASDDFEEESKKRKDKLNKLISLYESEDFGSRPSTDADVILEHLENVKKDKEYRQMFNEIMSSKIIKSKKEIEKEKKQQENIRKNIEDAKIGSRSVLDAINQNQLKKYLKE